MCVGTHNFVCSCSVPNSYCLRTLPHQASQDPHDPTHTQPYAKHNLNKLQAHPEQTSITLNPLHEICDQSYCISWLVCGGFISQEVHIFVTGYKINFRGFAGSLPHCGTLWLRRGQRSFEVAEQVYYWSVLSRIPARVAGPNVRSKNIANFARHSMYLIRH